VQPCIRYNGRDLPVGPVATKARELYFQWMEQGQRLV